MRTGDNHLMAHLIAGFPDIDTSLSVADGLVDGGAEYLEVQFPYSDPTADGPAIQSACSSALRGGVRLDDGFHLVARICRKHKTPVFIMSYAGTVFARGVKRFVDDARSSGAIGLIVPDLAPGFDESLYEHGASAGLEVVPVIAPSVSPSRLESILALKSPFLYAAIRIGITGRASIIDQSVADFLHAVRRSGTKLIAGFGIDSYDRALALQRHADVLVVGSAFVRVVADAYENGRNIYDETKEKARQLCGG